MINRRKFLGLSSIIMTAPALLTRAIADPSPPAKKYSYPEFDLYRIPFSYAGSYHTVNQKEDAGYSRLVINTVRRSAISYKWQSSWAHNLLEIALFSDGRELPFSTVATPWSLELTANGASALIVFADKDSLAIRTRNCALRIFPFRNFAWKYRRGEGNYIIYDSQPNHYYYLRTYDKKEIHFNKMTPALPNGSGNFVECEENVESTVLLQMITQETDVEPVLKNIDDLLSERKAEIERWMSRTPQAKKEHVAAVRTAWYLFWDLQVAPWGNYKRQSVLSSKKSMNMLWSWDICFNALALVRAQPALAWGQLLAVLDEQRKDGLLPDTVSDLQSGFGFNKPPVWGWTVMKMLPLTPMAMRRTYLEAVYPKIANFTNWWFRNRNLGGKGVCAYMHGNDSGWDNATIFDSGFPTESPDLTAFLVLQAEALAHMATQLGKDNEASGWTAVAKEQMTSFQNNFVTADGLCYRTLTPSGPEPQTSACLLTRIPLLLGTRLPEDTRTKLITELRHEGVFLTPQGLASEALNSGKYEPNGYWRGPVWAPSTYLIFDGLLNCGEKELARIVAQRFCDMVAKNASFNENYNAVTGEGQYDSGLTWTASDFLLMAEWLAENS